MTSGGPAPSLPLAPALMERWGIDHDAGRGVLSLAPRLVKGAPQSECPAFRAGRSVVVLSLRTRSASIRIRIGITFGPPLRVEIRLPQLGDQVPILVDDVPVTGPTVSFEARTTHEVVWLTG